MSATPTARASPPRRTARRWYQFGLLSLLLLVTAACLLVGWYARLTRKPYDGVALHIGVNQIKVGCDAVDFEALGAALARAGRKVDHSEIDRSATKVRVTVDDDATFGQFREAFHLCWDHGFSNVRLVLGKQRVEYVLVHWDFDSRCCLIPPFTLRITADEAGDQLQAMTPLRRGATPKCFAADVRDFVGTDQGSDSLRAKAVLKLDCDEQLKFKHIARYLIEAIETKPDGRRAPVIQCLVIDDPDTSEVLPELPPVSGDLFFPPPSEDYGAHLLILRPEHPRP